MPMDRYARMSQEKKPKKKKDWVAIGAAKQHLQQVREGFITSRQEAKSTMLGSRGTAQAAYHTTMGASTAKPGSSEYRKERHAAVKTRTESIRSARKTRLGVVKEGHKTIRGAIKGLREARKSK